MWPLNFSSSGHAPKGAKKTLKLLFGIGALVGTIALGSTLAASINLNDSGPVEFGQGVTQTIACSGTESLTITPNATFVNATGGGSFRFSSVKVSGVPSTCNGKNFTIRAYGDSSDNPLALFDDDATTVLAYNDGESFKLGSGLSGLTINSGDGTFTINFTTPVALSTEVFSITIESSTHTFNLGDTGPGGGTVFYVSPRAFTVAGSPCGSDCRYLEWAPNNWSGELTPDLSLRWSSGFANAVNGTGTAIGTGFENTRKILTSNPPYVGDDSGAAFRADAYRGGGKSDWFLPSLFELAAVSLYARSNGLLGGFDSGNYYQSSSEEVIGPTDTRSLTLRISDGESSLEYTGEGRPTRPIRAF
jgi:hypothetical protein